MSEPVELIRTLIVDDDFRVAAIHGAYVTKVDGFTVVGQAHSAAQAAELIDQLHPDLVLMDVYLPDGHGLAVMRAVGEHQRPPDFIVITAARDVETVRTAMQLGAMHYLVKPFGFDNLRERLQAYAEMRRRMAGLGRNAKQGDVDELFGLLRPAPSAIPLPNKGHSAPTLELVRNAVQSADGDVSAAEVAESLGISRATAQRYLSYLTRHGLLALQLRYGVTGRPEHRYRPAR
jgi:response regulator of citrate/malate metabolism